MIAPSSKGKSTCCTLSAHRRCISSTAASRFTRLVRASKPNASAPTNSGTKHRSMSSENRSITPNTLDNDVPPLNTKNGANSGCANNKPSNHDTQKSFSKMTACPAKPVAACSNTSPRRSGERDRNLAASVMVLALLLHAKMGASSQAQAQYPVAPVPALQRVPAAAGAQCVPG